MKALTAIVLIVSLCVYSSSFSQQSIKPLSIGDKVPDIKFGNILNYKNTTTNLSDFKGKLIILDLWSTWCSSCIDAFPKLDSLQEKLSDKIQILLVNFEGGEANSEAKIRMVLDKIKKKRNYYPSLPIPIMDTTLKDYFPYKYLPHQVWVDENGNIRAIIEGQFCTYDNIKKVLKDSSFQMPLKSDYAFDKDEPLSELNNTSESNSFIYRSLLTGYRSEIGYASGYRTNENGKITGWYFLNHPLQYLTRIAFQKETNVAANSLIFDVNKPDKFSLAFDTLNLYCYDLSFLPEIANRIDLNFCLQTDLKTIFNISLKKEKRKMKVLVLKAKDRISNYNTNFSHSDIEVESGSIKKYFHNIQFSQIVSFFNSRFDKPLIDETGISDRPIDIDFPEKFDLLDQKAVIELFKRLRFKILEEDRIVDVVVISDK